MVLFLPKGAIFMQKLKIWANFIYFSEIIITIFLQKITFCNYYKKVNFFVKNPFLVYIIFENLGVKYLSTVENTPILHRFYTFSTEFSTMHYVNVLILLTVIFCDFYRFALKD